jgi:hypothetical protein
MSWSLVFSSTIFLVYLFGIPLFDEPVSVFVTVDVSLLALGDGCTIAIGVRLQEKQQHGQSPFV